MLSNKYSEKEAFYGKTKIFISININTYKNDKVLFFTLNQ